MNHAASWGRFGLFGIVSWLGSSEDGRGIVSARAALGKGAFGKTAIAAALTLGLAACGTTREPAPLPRADLPPLSETLPDPGFEEPVAPPAPEPLTARHMNGLAPVRVALLLPLSAEDDGIRHVAEGMRDAAELALFQMNRPDVLVIPKDTRGEPAQAARAAQEALMDGAEIVLGPLLAESVRAVAPLTQAQGVPVIAFSSDRDVAGNGVYLLSFQVEEEIRRVVSFATLNDITSFAALVPENPYGEKVVQALQTEILNGGSELRHLQPYNPFTDDFRDPVRSIAEYGERREALAEQRTELASRQDEASRRALARLEETQTWGAVSYQAVLLPEGGTTLRSLAPMLPYFDIDNRVVRFLGTGLWDDPSLWSEPSLQGGWFAAPPPEGREGFQALFEQSFDARPPRLASLAYDAVTLAAALSSAPEGQRFAIDQLTTPGGFAGIDGLFRFRPDGTAERGLAVLQVTGGSVEVVSEAPMMFPADPEPAFDGAGTDGQGWGRDSEWQTQDPWANPAQDEGWNRNGTGL